VKEIDILVVTGGGFINHFWNALHRKKRLLSMLAVILLAEQMQKRIVFLGNTIGPFDESLNFYQFLLGNLKHAVYAVRDDMFSAGQLRQLGIDDKIHSLPDDLYFMNPWLKEGVRCEDSIKNRILKYSPYIILEFYMSMEEVEKQQVRISSLISEIQEKYGYKVIFVALDQGFGGMNQGEYLQQNISNFLLWNQEDFEYMPIEELLLLVQNAKFIICQRYHLSVLALANNTPFLQILKDVCGDKRYYYVKTIGMITKVINRNRFNDTDFLSLSLEDVFEQVEEQLPEIIQRQKELFDQQKELREGVQFKLRKEFINDIKCID